jgi:hypothetical protein
MANERRGEYLITLPVPWLNGDGTGKEFDVRLTANTVGDAEAYTPDGVGLAKMIEHLTTGNLHFGELRALYFTACRGQHGMVTLEQSGEVLGAAMKRGLLVDAANVIANALNELFPAYEDEEGN